MYVAQRWPVLWGNASLDTTQMCDPRRVHVSSYLLRNGDVNGVAIQAVGDTEGIRKETVSPDGMLAARLTASA